MEIRKHLHWFLTSRCNSDCTYCFRPRFGANESKSNLMKIAGELVRNKVKRVTLTGGEPMLVQGIEDVLRFFSDSGVYVSLHTNGTLLDKRRIQAMKEIVGDIAIPIDSMDRQTQEMLRREDVLPRVLNVARQISDEQIKLGIHTVFSSLNYQDLPGIYRFLRHNGFDYWRIYEFNPDLVADQFDSITRFSETQELEGTGSPEKGGTDSLFAEFLLADERFRRYKDKRVQFVSPNYQTSSYVFVDSNGDFSYCPWFSQKRTGVGNLFKQGFEKIEKKLDEIEKIGDDYAEHYADALNNLPLFARVYDGAYWEEEFDALDNRSMGKLVRLAELYLDRIGVKPGKLKVA